MNIELVKNEIKNKLGKRVLITVHGMRSRIDYYEGILYQVYPNIFTIKYHDEEKSFPYRDLITKDITIKYL